MDEPNDEHIAQMAFAALAAAFDKAEELGLARMQGLFGIEGAMGAIKMVAVLNETLGPDGMQALEKALQDGMSKDAVQQAEDILKGEA
jgi:ferritin-like metal-binding protein YciE